MWKMAFYSLFQYIFLFCAFLNRQRHPWLFKVDILVRSEVSGEKSHPLLPLSITDPFICLGKANWAWWELGISRQVGRLQPGQSLSYCRGLSASCTAALRAPVQGTAEQGPGVALPLPHASLLSPCCCPLKSAAGQHL